jgi:conjugative transposon TraM protein
MSTNNQTDDKPRLSNEQKQKLKKYAVFALMGIICAGSMWLIFAPSADEKAKQEQTAGFNADIPLPKEEGIIDNKKDAYEQEQMKQKQEERMRSLSDFTAMLGGDSEAQTPQDDLVLLDSEPAKPQTGGTVRTGGTGSRSQSSIQQSTQAYHDINRTLGSFYEKPREDPEKEALKQELEELKNRMDESEAKRNMKEEQMEMMEKSFQMASKYMPMTTGTAGTPFAANAEPATAGTGTSTNVSGKTTVIPVSQVREQTVSSLAGQNMSDADFVRAFGQPRNMGFLTATAGEQSGTRNTIPACIHGDQTIMGGQSVRLRLIEPLRAGKMVIPRNTVMSGTAKIQGERLQITINSMEYNGSIIPVEMAVYDTDGQRGIFIPDTKEINAAKGIAANMGTNAGTSISLSSDAGEQFAADMGRSAI